jgi:hypothetical protein
MPRRWWFVTLTVLVIGFTALWSLFVVAQRPRQFINRENFERIEVGMTVEEVKTILGLPPGDHTVFRRSSGVEDARGRGWLVWADPIIWDQTWASDEGIIFFLFEGDKVIRREFADPSGTPRRGFLDVLGRLVLGKR